MGDEWKAAKGVCPYNNYIGECVNYEFNEKYYNNGFNIFLPGLTQLCAIILLILLFREIYLNKIQSGAIMLLIITIGWSVITIITWPLIPGIIRVKSNILEFKEGKTIFCNSIQTIDISNIRKIEWNSDESVLKITSVAKSYEINIQGLESNAFTLFKEIINKYGIQLIHIYKFKGLDDDIINKELEN